MVATYVPPKVTQRFREENTTIVLKGRENAEIWFMDRMLVSVANNIATIRFNPATLRKDTYDSIFYVLVYFMTNHKILCKNWVTKYPPWSCQNDVVRTGEVISIVKGSKVTLPAEFDQMWYWLCHDRVAMNKPRQASLVCEPGFHRINMGQPDFMPPDAEKPIKCPLRPLVRASAKLVPKKKISCPGRGEQMHHRSHSNCLGRLLPDSPLAIIAAMRK